MNRLMTKITAMALGWGLLMTGVAYAGPTTVGGLTFSEVSGGFTITGNGGGTGTELDPIIIFETVTGGDLVMSIEGLDTPNFGNPAGTGHVTGFWLQKVVTNNTGEVWNFYDHELQEELGTASADGDGLSFAQGCTNSCRPWTSDKFANFDEIVDPRDFVNFFNGTVNIGETVTFNYAITDNSPIDIFYLRQRPNFSPNEVAEPGVLALLGLGLLGFGLFRRRVL